MSSRIPTKKVDHSQLYRAEIEERTANGETCEQIASSFRQRQIPLSRQKISRRRVEWGLRKRPFRKGKPTSDAISKPKQPVRRAGKKSEKQNAMKQEIQLRTQNGESADQIVAALEAQGHEFKKGASTILRLQTTWGLIAKDKYRARGRKRPVEKISKREIEREANKQQQTQTMHYPTNCSFGPKKRAKEAQLDVAEGGDMGFDYELESLPVVEHYSTEPPATQPQTTHRPSVSVAAEIMSAEFLVDLATSTLDAANNLKQLLLDQSLSGISPTLEDLSTARRKVREAAAVMHDLAIDPTPDVAAG